MTWRWQCSACVQDQHERCKGIRCECTETRRCRENAEQTQARKSHTDPDTAA